MKGLKLNVPQLLFRIICYIQTFTLKSCCETQWDQEDNVACSPYSVQLHTKQK
jgi:hypothetical protein